MSVSVKVEDITPAKAESWLGKASPNRNLRQSKVIEYAEAMKRGEWRLSGESVKWNGSTLIDGQHRLRAIIESGTTVQMVVVRGLDTNAMDVLDTGVKRTLHDVLKIRGEVNTALLSAALAGIWQTRIAIDTGTWPHKNTRRFITNIQALELLEAEPEIREAVSTYSVMKNRNGFAGLRTQPTVLVTSYYLLGDVDEKDRDAFFQLLRGIDVAEGSPVERYRRRMSGGLEMPTNRRDQMALTFKTWNYWRNGEWPMLLSFKAGGKKPERFPVPV